MTLSCCAVAARVSVIRAQTWFTLGDRRYELRRAPWAVQAFHDELVARTALSCPPALFVTDSLDGRGGVWTRELIVLALDELGEIARRIWRDRFLNGRRVQHERFWNPDSPVAQITLNGVRAAVVRFTLAHEVGHALAWEQGSARAGVAGEHDADMFAGIALREMRADGVVEPLVAEAFGCRAGAVVCTHPAPAVRRGAFETGTRVSEIFAVRAEGSYVIG